MNRTVVRVGILVTLLTGLVIFPSPVSTAGAETIYTFETCEEGWTVEENFADAPGGDWMRSAPGDGSAFAMRIFPYAVGAGSPGDLYEVQLIAPVHSIAGGNITVSYALAYNTEAGFDYVHFETSTNDTDWVGRKTYDGLSEGFPTFIKEEVSFNHPGGRLYSRFRLTSDQLISGNGNDGSVAVDDVTYPAARPAGASCDGEPPPPPPEDTCDKSGTGGNDNLKGTNKADTICGKGGNDRIEGLGGNDILKGQAGRDTLIGGPGNDRLLGSKGKGDVCKGGGGRDTYKGCEQEK